MNISIIPFRKDIRMEDKRNVKTERLIRSVFLELLKEKSINKITVAEISRKADLGRGTFYLHYSDVYDLYESIEKEVIDKLKEMFKESFPTTDTNNSMKLVTALVGYIENNKELFKILVSSDTGNTMYKIKKSFYSDVFDENTAINPMMNSQYSFTESVFVVSGIIGVLERWIMDGFKVSSSSIAEMLNKIISKVNNG